MFVEVPISVMLLKFVGYSVDSLVVFVRSARDVLVGGLELEDYVPALAELTE